MSSAKKFTLLEAFIPVVDGKLVVKDTGMGGLKLVYTTSNAKSTSLTKKEKQIEVFLKPYKSVLSIDKESCTSIYGKNAWGNTSQPLSNIWLRIVSRNYSNFEKDFMSIRHEIVTDPSLISFLNKTEKEFILGSDDSINTKPSLLEKARLFINQIKRK